MSKTDPDGRGSTIRSPGVCHQEFMCPFTVDCGGKTLKLVSCGTGTCENCPPGAGNLIVKAWCAYESDTCPKKYASLFKSIFGGYVGFMKLCYD